jgi:hypothetical protein
MKVCFIDQLTTKLKMYPQTALRWSCMACSGLGGDVHPMVEVGRCGRELDDTVEAGRSDKD